MSQPPGPVQGSVDQDSSSAASEGQAREESGVTSAQADDNRPPAPRPASAHEARQPSPAETISTLADEPDAAPADVLARTIADAVGTSPVDSTDSATFQLGPRESPDSSSDVDEHEAPPRLDQVAGYKILKVLGQGGMGVVYKARQRGLKRIVALKMIVAGGHQGSADLARFRSEAVAVADLQHPNIVQIYEVGEDNGHPFFSLEYVAGGSLAKKISGTPRPPREAAQLVRALADGMEYAHQRGIIHRDLKPANVLLTESGEPKVSDFGLVKRLEDDAGQTQSGSILGTPSYMAPEQAEGKIKEIGPRTDIYALGGILYELMTGRPPFRAASVLDTLQQVRTQDPIPPSQFHPKVPRDLETICLKCLQKDPAKRYASAADLGEDLRRFLSGESILARPVSRAEWFWRLCLRNPRVAALSAILAILVVAWAASSTLLYRLARANERTALANAASASQNAALAELNAQKASSKAQEALANAEPARRNAELASANETRARNQEQAAKGIAQDAIAQMIHLGEQVMRRLRTKHDPARAEAEWLRLRDDLLVMLQKEVVPLAERIEGQGVSPFAFATFHQRLGDLLRSLGQFADAQREFQQGYDRIARIAHDQPNNDVARANLGVMLLRLGEMALEERGDAAQAHDQFDRAWKIQEEISLHPRSGNYSKTDNHRILSGIAIKQGTALLSLGHPDLARDRFLKALELRHAWTAAEPRNASAKSYLAEAESWVGVALSHLGDWQGARPHFDEALKICAMLAAQHPGHLPFKGDLASVYSEQGAAMARSGQLDEATQAFNKSLNYSRAVLAHDPEDAAQRLVTAGVSERLAALAHKRGELALAEKLWRSALEIRTELAQLETQNVPAQVALTLALAHTGRRDLALKKAEEMLRTNPDRPAVLLPLARCFAACAAGASTDVDRRRALALAQDALSAALRNGYRDLVAIQTDPEFTQLLAEPALKNLVNGIRP
jgi:eukaryotic-like serine/threonine-protein kinase